MIPDQIPYNIAHKYKEPTCIQKITFEPNQIVQFLYLAAPPKVSYKLVWYQSDRYLISKSPYSGIFNWMVEICPNAYFCVNMTNVFRF